MLRFRKILSFLKLDHIIKRGYAFEIKKGEPVKFMETINPNIDDMLFSFMSANEMYYNNEVVKQVDVPSFVGQFGILARHVPMLTVLKPGIVTVFQTDGKITRIFVSSGSVTINIDSSVIILAEEAHPIDSFDAAACKLILEEAKTLLLKAKTPKEKATAEISLEVAEELVRCVS